MKNTMDRRTLLTSAVLGTTATLVGATAMGSLAPETAFAAGSQNPEPGTPTRTSPKAGSPLATAACSWSQVPTVDSTGSA